MNNGTIPVSQSFAVCKPELYGPSHELAVRRAFLTPVSTGQDRVVVQPPFSPDFATMTCQFLHAIDRPNSVLLAQR